MKIAGAILAGGKAERLGGAVKGLLRLPGGMTVVEHLRGEMQAAGFSPMALCAGEHNCYADLGMAVVRDRVPERGPLAGIEAALARFQGYADAVAMVPCDMPRVTAAEFARLRAAFGPERGRIVLAATGAEAWHPLCSIVHIGLLPEITRALEERRLSVHRLWRELGALPVLFQDGFRFANVNTPDDCVRFLGGTDEDGEA